MMTWVAAEWVQSKPRHLRQGRMPTSKRKGIPWKCSLPKDYIHHPTQSKHHPNPTTTPPKPLGWYIIIIIIKVFNQKKIFRWHMRPPKKTSTPQFTMLVKKGQHSVPSFQFPKFVLGQPWAAFPICGILVGFGWAFDGLLVVLIGN